MKTCTESLVQMQHLILPNDTNFLNNLMGGKLMYWFDEAAAMAAMKHSGQICVTASADNLLFKKPISLGEVVAIEAKVTRTFSSSLEVCVRAWRQNYLNGFREKTHDAFFTFVAMDKQMHKPVTIEPILAQTQEEKELYEGALKRRQLRLFLAKKISLSQAEIQEIIH